MNENEGWSVWMLEYGPFHPGLANCIKLILYHERCDSITAPISAHIGESFGCGCIDKSNHLKTWVLAGMMPLKVISYEQWRTSEEERTSLFLNRGKTSRG